MNNITEKDWKCMNEIIREINQHFDTKIVRLKFLEMLKSIIEYDFGIFDLSKIKNGEFDCLYDPVMLSKYGRQFEENFISKYDNEFCNSSYTSWIYYEKRPIVYRETDVVSEEFRERSNFFKNYLEPVGLTYSCGCNIVYDNINLGAVSLYRSNENGDFDDRELYILEQLQPHLINKLSQSAEIVKEFDARTRIVNQYCLTEREMEIIELVYEGYGNQDIGEDLCISVNTVKKHLSNIFGKMELKSRSQLIHLLNENDFK
jgi:DNA-binding CsgD family transcriptional regulator